ncbi:MAG: hypothetical protein KBE65_19680 [Phycisphaerae bacterium]|nr:hypothetical protein [Phycisphaerae bacterium]
MKKTVLWVMLVTIAHVLLSEALCRVSIHWRESSQELAGMALFVLLLAGLIWAVWRAFRRLSTAPSRVACRAALIVGLFAATYTFDYFYYWHLRPNLGWYQESDWVAQHPGFQRELRARIQANLWCSSASVKTPDAP